MCMPWIEGTAFICLMESQVQEKACDISSNKCLLKSLREKDSVVSQTAYNVAHKLDIQGGLFQTMESWLLFILSIL